MCVEYRVKYTCGQVHIVDLSRIRLSAVALNVDIARHSASLHSSGLTLTSCTIKGVLRLIADGLRRKNNGSEWLPKLPVSLQLMGFRSWSRMENCPACRWEAI